MYYTLFRMNITIKTVRTLRTANGKSKSRFATTSDGAYLAIKNNWAEVKTFKSWAQMLFQYNRWLDYTNAKGEKTFIAGWSPKKATTATPQEVAPAEVSADAQAAVDV